MLVGFNAASGGVVYNLIGATVSGGFFFNFSVGSGGIFNNFLVGFYVISGGLGGVNWYSGLGGVYGGLGGFGGFL